MEMMTKTTNQLKRFSCFEKVIHRDMKIRRSDPTWQECMEADMSPAQKEVFMAIDEWWKRCGSPAPKRLLSRSEIRLRVAGVPPSPVMVKHLIKTVAQLHKELACLKKKLGC